MEALILASGVGRRLGTFGKKEPKCMINISKKIKIIDLLIKEIIREVSRIYIVVGYKKNHIINYLKESKKIEFIKNKQYSKRGNYFSAFLGKRKISGKFILLDADIILPKNSLKKFILKKKNNLMMVNPLNDFNKDDIIINCDGRNKIKQLSIKKINYKSSQNYSASGVIKMSSSSKNIFFKELEKIHKKGEFNNYYEEAFFALFKKKNFFISELSSSRLEIDTVKDLMNVKEILKNNNTYV